MMRSAIIVFITLAAGAMLSCCSSGREAQASGQNESGQMIPKEGPLSHYMDSKPRNTNNMIPRAVIYRTNGDYRLNVPVGLNDEGTELLSYPAPTDLSAASEPLQLTDGWLLDRRGVTANSAFTRYTYSEYEALPAPPSPEQLMKSIIPGARVTNLRTLECTLPEALADTAAVNRIIRGI